MNLQNTDELKYETITECERTNENKHYYFPLWGSKQHFQNLSCRSQGDTVLVGGPPGGKGNKGETVSGRPKAHCSKQIFTQRK